VQPTLGKEPEHRCAHREQVCTGVNLGAKDLLGRHIRRGAELRPGSGLELEGDPRAHACDTEIENLEPSVRLDEKVIGLDVAVDNSLGVGRHEHVEQLVHEAQQHLDGHPSGLPRELGERRPFEELHHEKRSAVLGHVNVANLDRTWVLQAVHGVGLLLEARTHLGHARYVGVEDLDSLAPADLVNPHIDRSHPPGTEQSLERPLVAQRGAHTTGGLLLGIHFGGSRISPRDARRSSRSVPRRAPAAAAQGSFDANPKLRYRHTVSSFLEFFARLFHARELLQWGGYPVLMGIVFSETGLLVGFFLPGDSLLVTAGVLVSQGELLNPLGVSPLTNLLVMNAALFAMAVIGDAVGFSIGYRAGPVIFTREQSFFFRRDHLIATQKFYEKHGGKTIILARFMPFVRTFAPVVAGVGKMTYRRFFAFNVFGGLGWVLSMTVLGYFLGTALGASSIEKIVYLIVLISVAPLGIGWLKSYLKARAEKRAAPGPAPG
jgi:membrane-associated protein